MLRGNSCKASSRECDATIGVKEGRGWRRRSREHVDGVKGGNRWVGGFSDMWAERRRRSRAMTYGVEEQLEREARQGRERSKAPLGPL